MLFLLFALTGVSGQSVSKKRSKQAAAPSAIERASQLRAKDPAAAIRTLSDLIQSRPGSSELTEAFILLGDIYSDIEQADLALGRYERAVETADPADKNTASLLSLKRGRVYLAQGNQPQARAMFTACLDLAPAGSAQNIACREGLADLEAISNNFEQSQNYYNQVQTAQPADSLLQLRVNAKRSNVYLQQNDLQNSANSLNEAIKQAPRNAELPVAETKELVAANANYLKAVEKESGREAEPTVELLPSAPVPLVVMDNFERFRSLREKGQPRQAATKLAEAIDRIDAATPAEISTKIYAEGADFYLDRNQTDRAAAVYRNYTLANNQLLAEKREELDRQVAVLREQQRVDLGLKDLRSEETEGRLLSQQVSLQRWLIYLLGALLLGALLSVLLILRNVRRRRRANQELLLRNLQTRMNPHFIFNSLNSINNYIARQDERSANRYLGRFAKLMRNVMDQSGKDFVPLHEEIEQLGLYLELEKERFSGKFDYELPDADTLPPNLADLELPPMILQPFVENAIWHGLRYRPDSGQLKLEFEENGGTPVIVITDNGIGRDKSAELKTDNQRQHRSTGMATSRQRLELINLHYGKNFRIEVADAFPGEEFVGTRVRVWLVHC